MEMYLSWGLGSPISTAFLFEVIFVEYILRELLLRPDGRAYTRQDRWFYAAAKLLW